MHTQTRTFAHRATNMVIYADVRYKVDGHEPLHRCTDSSAIAETLNSVDAAWCAWSCPQRRLFVGIVVILSREQMVRLIAELWWQMRVRRFALHRTKVVTRLCLDCWLPQFSWLSLRLLWFLFGKCNKRENYYNIWVVPMKRRQLN